MLSRRQFAVSGSLVAASPLALQGCTPSGRDGGYEDAVAKTWRPPPQDLSNSALLRRELVRYATLAPSSHNTQCWKFSVAEQSISILPDQTRRCPAVDPDDHHLYVSLGCAAENLVKAALANGLQGEAVFETAPADVLKVNLQPTRRVESPLFKAISERQCTRNEFDGQPVSAQDLRLMALAGTGKGVQLLLFTEKPAMENVLEYVVQGNTAQMKDPAFVAELKTWIRFNDAEAVRTGDGLFAKSSGNPSVPRWLESPLFPVFFQDRQRERQVRQTRSQLRWNRRFRVRCQRQGPLGRGRSLLRTLRLAGGCAWHPQCVPESAGRSLNTQAAVRQFPRRRRAPPRPGGAVWPGAGNAAVVASADAERPGVKRRIKPVPARSH